MKSHKAGRFDEKRAALVGHKINENRKKKKRKVDFIHIVVESHRLCRFL